MLYDKSVDFAPETKGTASHRSFLESVEFWSSCDLLQEGHRHGTLKTFNAVKTLYNCQSELRECLIPMKSALS